jgi:GMP synthase-like glutamine amidotransferase
MTDDLLKPPTDAEVVADFLAGAKHAKDGMITAMGDKQYYILQGHVEARTELMQALDDARDQREAYAKAQAERISTAFAEAGRKLAEAMVKLSKDRETGGRK